MTPGLFIRITVYCSIEIIILLSVFLYREKVPLKAIPLSHDTSLYSDRSYMLDMKRCPDLTFSVLQIPRHLDSKLYLKSSDSLTLYRPLCKKNNNSWARDWKPTPCEISVPGATCRLNTLVSKQFDAPEIQIAPGTPVASSPILIEGSPESFSIEAYYHTYFSRRTRQIGFILPIFMFGMGELMLFVIKRKLNKK